MANAYIYSLKDAYRIITQIIISKPRLSTSPLVLKMGVSWATNKSTNNLTK